MKHLVKFDLITEAIKISSLTFYADPGHGWLKVPIAELKKLGIENDISSYSYQLGKYAYLEEDSDLSIYINALMTAHGYTEDRRAEFLEFFRKHVKQEHTNKQSRIRNYQPYKVFSDDEKQRMEKIRQALYDCGIRWNSKSINRIKKASLEDLEYWVKKFNLTIDETETVELKPKPKPVDAFAQGMRGYHANTGAAGPKYSKKDGDFS